VDYYIKAYAIILSHVHYNAPTLADWRLNCSDIGCNTKSHIFKFTTNKTYNIWLWS